MFDTVCDDQLADVCCCCGIMHHAAHVSVCHATKATTIAACLGSSRLLISRGGGYADTQRCSSGAHVVFTAINQRLNQEIAGQGERVLFTHFPTHTGTTPRKGKTPRKECGTPCAGQDPGDRVWVCLYQDSSLSTEACFDPISATW